MNRFHHQGQIPGTAERFVNSVATGDGFYISYNPSARDYGCKTTAVVVTPPDDGFTQFYILNGDHRDAYAGLIDQGLDACLTYFRDHVDLVSQYSNKLPDDGPSFSM